MVRQKRDGMSASCPVRTLESADGRGEDEEAVAGPGWDSYADVGARGASVSDILDIALSATSIAAVAASTSVATIANSASCSRMAVKARER